jgi:Fe-S-cluster containining protein
MTLENADVERLAARGQEGFFAERADGALQLYNRGGRCVFLGEDGRCRVYDDRPEGCRLYPLILDVVRNVVILHDDCPWAREFEVDGASERRLRASVAREEAEAAARRPTAGVEPQRRGEGGARNRIR